MRLIATLLVAALLAAAATAITQGEARNIENRRKDCSEIVKGRLGTLVADDGTPMSYTFNTHYNVTVLPDPSDTKGIVETSVFLISGMLTPCPLPTTPSSTVTISPITINNGTSFTGTYTNLLGNGNYIDFTMPTKLGQVATVDTVFKNAANGLFVAVTFSCGGAPTAVAGTVDLTVLSATYTQNGGIFKLNLQTPEACPRFPYSNKGVPGGGIAAIIIVIITFILQFGACFKYHKDLKAANIGDSEMN